MKRVRLVFSECEHDGDLDNYSSDVIKCGGSLFSKSVDHDAECGVIIAEVPDNFRDKIMETDSGDFLELLSYCK